MPAGRLEPTSAGAGGCGHGGQAIRAPTAALHPSPGTIPSLDATVDHWTLLLGMSIVRRVSC